MRILYLVSGRDALWGGATVRDAAFVRGLTLSGHEVEAVSISGRALVDGAPDEAGLFKQLAQGKFKTIFPILTRVPLALAGMMRKPRTVKDMTSFAVAGHVDRNGPTAVNVLAGRDKLLRREFSRLIEHLRQSGFGRPDVVVLANAMLTGLAQPLRASLGSRIVCLSQGSDRYVEELAEPYRSDARKLVRKNARHLAMVIATSRFFAIRATEFLALPPTRVKVVPPGIDADKYPGPETRARNPFVIGFLAPISHASGLDILIDAIDSLCKKSAFELELWIAGRVADDRYWQRLKRRLDSTLLKDRHRVLGPMNVEERRAFYPKLSVFAVPSRVPESRGVQILEAMACGIPVVGPASGIIPEIFQHVSGGLLVSSDSPVWMLAQALELLATIPETADQMGKAAAEGVRRHFSVQHAADRLAEALSEVAVEARDESVHSPGSSS